MFKKTESFDDIVFKDRNKSYGAYDLRKRYSKRGSIALAVSLFILFVSVGVPLIAGIINRVDILVITGLQGPATLSNFDDPIATPPPPPPPPAPSINDVKIKPLNVVDSLTTEEKDILTNDEINGKTNSTPVDTTSHATYVEKKADPIDETIYDPIKITEPVDFLGGTQGLMKFIAQNTIYPPSAQEYEIEGTVYVRFAVMKTGAIGNVILLKSSGDPILDNEALRVVKLIPQCTPGKINGNPVSSWFIVPVKFKLLK